jgi:4-diphosphocytidyl-2-C-methyl-D-erythritol kinase
LNRVAFVDSPAKINLHLDVFGKREDGFHELFSLFQMISLFDHIKVSEKGRGGICTIDGPFAFSTDQNIMYKAVNLFREETGYDRSVHIEIDKKIPQGGGLGGGSGNGASLLKALEILSGIKISQSRLLELGAALGSDVPFFLGTPAAEVRGRGEVLKPVKPRTDFYILLAVPDFSVNTGEAFSLLAQYREKRKPEHPLKPDQVLRMYRDYEVRDWQFHNSFLNCLKKEHNVLEHILNLFYYSNADFAGMSGSGSVMFGIFSRQEDCISASEKLSETPVSIIFVNPLDTAVVAELQFN